MEPVFVYGNLMEAQVQQKAFGRVVESKFDTLFDYKKGEAHKNGNTLFSVFPARGHSVHGFVLYLSPEEMAYLDKNLASYSRIKIILPNGKGAWTYVVQG